MRIDLTIGYAVLLWAAGSCAAVEPASPNRDADSASVDVRAVLREACEIVRKQDDEQSYWCERELLEIGKVQIRAGDFDGALESIRSSTYDYGRNAGLIDLAEAIAGSGQRERAFEVLRLVGSNHCWRQDYMDDGVQLCWIDHLTASGDLASAGKAVEQLKSDRYRPDGLWKLAAAYANSGKADKAAKYFAQAIAAGEKLKEDYDRAQALWEAADAQLAAKMTDAAKATVRRLVETGKIKEPWARVCSLVECAELSAKTGDAPAARRLFAQAIDAQADVNALNKIGALERVAVAQAGVGYTGDALQTAALIVHSEEDFTQNGGRERVLLAVATTQIKSGDLDAAVRTASSIKYYLQYHDDILQAVVDRQIAKREFKAALATAEKIDEPSRKATAVLKIAIAQARSGDRKSAADTAARIELVSESDGPFGEKVRFDFRRPQTWGVRYGAGFAATNSSSQRDDELAAEVAAAAMTLAQVIEQPPEQSYAVLFADIITEEVIQALARAQAAAGDPRAALAWAQQIGSSDKVKSLDDFESLWPVLQRFHALVGVAEGVLDRSSDARPKPELESKP